MSLNQETGEGDSPEIELLAVVMQGRLAIGHVHPKNETDQRGCGELVLINFAELEVIRLLDKAPLMA